SMSHLRLAREMHYNPDVDRTPIDATVVKIQPSMSILAMSILAVRLGRGPAAESRVCRAGRRRVDGLRDYVVAGPQFCFRGTSCRSLRQKLASKVNHSFFAHAPASRLGTLPSSARYRHAVGHRKATGGKSK